MASSPITYAVLSGDLVASRRHSEAVIARAMAALATAADGIAIWPGMAPTIFTRFRGDGWQIALNAPHLACRALVVMAASLKRDPDLPESRIAIGIGPAAPLPDDSLSSATGAAFEYSGHSLDSLSKSDRYSIDGQAVTALHKATLTLASEIIGGWSPEQAEAAALYLVPETPTQVEVAHALGITPQATHARLRGASALALRRALTLWEEAR